MLFESEPVTYDLQTARDTARPCRLNDLTQRGRVVRSVVFTTAMIARLMVQLPPKPRCCVESNKQHITTPTQASLLRPWNKMLHDNYLCLVESNKQQIKEVGSKTQAENSETRSTPKRVWIRPMYAVAFS